MEKPIDKYLTDLWHQLFNCFVRPALQTEVFKHLICLFDKFDYIDFMPAKPRMLF